MPAEKYCVSISITPEYSESQDDNLDPEELEIVTHNLYDDLSQLDTVEKVDLVSEGKAPQGSKSGGEIVSWGSLLVTLAASGTGVLPNLVGTLQSWLTRHERQKIIMQLGPDKLELTGASDLDRQKLIDSWISRHSHVQS
jgi:hypothetical protein